MNVKGKILCTVYGLIALGALIAHRGNDLPFLDVTSPSTPPGGCALGLPAVDCTRSVQVRPGQARHAAHAAPQLRHARLPVGSGKPRSQGPRFPCDLTLPVFATAPPGITEGSEFAMPWRFATP